MSAEPDRSHQKPPFLKRVRIRNYKSTKFRDVELEPLTVLVGRNGSGKSNFVDALGFLRDVFEDGVETAVTKHGGWRGIIHRDGEAKEVSFECEFSLNAGQQANVTQHDPTWFDIELVVSLDFTVREDSHSRPTISTESSEYRVVGRGDTFGLKRDAEGNTDFASTLPDSPFHYPAFSAPAFCGVAARQATQRDHRNVSVHPCWRSLPPNRYL